MAYLWWPNRIQLAAAGYGAHAHIPVLFDTDWVYLRIFNRYLRERASLEWLPGTSTDPRARFERELSRRITFPTKKTLENIARHLCNFIEWLHWSNRDWHALNYREGVLAYQADMQAGTWSSRESGLSPGTVNARIGEACSFLSWAADRGLREQFAVLAVPVSSGVRTGNCLHGDVPKVVQARAGGVRPNPVTLRIPSEDEVVAWLTEVRVKRGPTKALMCALILETGIRLQEAVQWRFDTLPLLRSDWVIIGHNVQVTIRYGAKGAKPLPDSDEGPARKISLPLSVAIKLDEYRNVRRAVLLGRWVQSAKSKDDLRARRLEPAPVRLFLSDHTYRPFSDQALYDGWKKVDRIPFKEWSPHLGRHYWACRTLLRSIQERAISIGRQLDALPDDWITSQATTDIKLIIQPQLGHLSEETTQGYLTWLHGVITLTKYTHEYHDFMDRIDG